MINSRPNLLALVLFPLITSATTENLNIKPGLWEVTSTMESKGTPPMPAAERAQMEKEMAKMSPENRAKMEAAIKSAQANLAKPVVRRSCITKEDLSKPLPFAGGRDDGTCTRTIIKSTSSVQEQHLDCTSKTRKSSGTIRVVAANPETWTSTLDGSMSDTGGAITMKAKSSGKWLGADCGNVKPSAHK